MGRMVSVGLNIKNERVHALAREAARRTGKTQTSVIEDALEALLAGLADGDAESAAGKGLDRLLAEIKCDTTGADRAALRRASEELYDDVGMPA